MSRDLDLQATALTIAGSDPSGGAGLQADLKTFQQLGVYGMSVVTLATVQNTRSVAQVHSLPSDLVMAQLDAVLEDIAPRVVKTGALGEAGLLERVAARLQSVEAPLVVDPVLVSKHGDSLAGDEMVAAYRRRLLPLADLVTPNRFETERLTDVRLQRAEADAEALEDAGQEAASKLLSMGARHVLIKLGQVGESSLHLLAGEEGLEWIATPRLPANNTHGAGCILAAAAAAQLALGETNIGRIARTAVERTLECIATDNHLGGGLHPAEIRAMSRC